MSNNINLLFGIPKGQTTSIQGQGVEFLMYALNESCCLTLAKPCMSELHPRKVIDNHFRVEVADIRQF